MYKNKHCSQKQASNSKTSKKPKKRLQTKSQKKTRSNVSRKGIISPQKAHVTRPEKCSPHHSRKPFKLFNKGEKSKIEYKCCNLNEESKGFNKNFHGFLQEVATTGSNAINRPKAQYTHDKITDCPTHYASASDYYVKLEREQNAGTRSMSLFKELNSRFRDITVKRTTSTITSGQTYFTSSQEGLQSSFCKHLKIQLSKVTLPNIKARCIENVKALAAEIDAVLGGHKVMGFPFHEKFGNRKIGSIKQVVVPQLIPRSMWMYETPNNQRLRRRRTASRISLKPYIMQTNLDSKVFFELDDMDMGDLKVFEENFDSTFCPPFATSTNNILFSCLQPIATADNFKLRFGATPEADRLDPLRNDVLLFNNTSPIFQPSEQAKHLWMFPQSSTDTKEFMALPSFGKLKEQISSSNDQPKGFFQVPYHHFNDENFAVRDVSNHPNKSDFQLNEPFVMDEQLFLPQISTLDNPSPLTFCSGIYLRPE